MHNETVRCKPDPRSQACVTPGCDLVYIGRVVVTRILAAKSLVQLQVSSCLSVCKCLAALD